MLFFVKFNINYDFFIFDLTVFLNQAKQFLKSLVGRYAVNNKLPHNTPQTANLAINHQIPPSGIKEHTK